MSQLAEFGRLASGVFHDLASPISALILNLQDIQKGQHHTDSIRQHLSVSMRTSARIAALISILRKHFGSESSKVLFSANEIIEDVLAIFNHKALKLGVDMRFDSTRKISLYGNTVDFYQIASNLISNAIDSYDDMPRKDARLSEHPRHVVITLGVRNKRVILKVSDRGSGISPSVLPNIFNQFFTTKSGRSALGIGLNVTRTAIEEGFSGSIQVESTEGFGTTFTVYLPSSSDTFSP
jgi:signal transduction histidine kinase